MPPRKKKNAEEPSAELTAQTPEVQIEPIEPPPFVSELDRLAFDPGLDVLDELEPFDLDEREAALFLLIPELTELLGIPEALLEERPVEDVWGMVLKKIDLTQRSVQESSVRVQEAHAYSEVFRHLCEIMELPHEESNAPNLIQKIRHAKASETLTAERVKAWISENLEAATRMGFRAQHATRAAPAAMSMTVTPASPSAAETMEFRRPRPAQPAPEPAPAQAPTINPRYGTRVTPIQAETPVETGPINPRYGTPMNSSKGKQKRAKGVFPPLSQNAGSIKYANRAPATSTSAKPGPRNPRYEHKLARPGSPPRTPVTVQKPSPPEPKTQEPAVDEFLLNSPETIKAWCLNNKPLAGKLGIILVKNLASPPEIIQQAVDNDLDLADNDDVQQILEWAADNRGAATTLVMQLIPLLQP